MFASVLGKVTHQSLANTLPFYCCWLVDVEDESKPCAVSAVAGSMLYTLRLGQLAPSSKIWLN